MPPVRTRRILLQCCSLWCVIFMVYNWIFPCTMQNLSRMVPSASLQYMKDSLNNRTYPYDRQMPLIFIGGVPRSGTTLMRAMLDAHPDVRCGEETRVIPRLLGMRTQWSKSPKESVRLKEAGLTEDVIDSALAAFILEVIAKHGEAAPRLCNKDPFTLKSSIYLSQLFPSSKYILMIRDGRAVVHSIISRHVTISGFDLNNYRACLQRWNQAMETMYMQCLHVGFERCMPVYYEQVVLHPEQWMRRILKFLDIPWNPSVLYHHNFINKPGGVAISKTERSTDQIIKPINLNALSEWTKTIPADVKADAGKIAPMLEKLGYDTTLYPPKYGEADKFVADNTIHVINHKEYWNKRSAQIVHHTEHPV